VNRAGIAILAGACLLIAPACNSTHDGATAQQPTTHGAPPPKQPKERGTFQRPVPSPDGKRVGVVRHFGRWGYLEVGHAGGGPRQTIFSSRYICCGDIVWASRYVIAFDADYIVKTIDVRSRRVRAIAAASDFNISNDGRWIAWWTLPGDVTEGPGPAGVVSIARGECLLVPTPSTGADLFLDFHPATRAASTFCVSPRTAPRGRSACRCRG
jgi:hypothetical protein